MAKTFIKQYIKKNKDILLTKENFNEVDAAILSTLCLIDVRSCIPFEGEQKITTVKLALHSQIKKHGVSKLGLILPVSLTKALLQASQTERFGNLVIHDLHQNVSNKSNTQSTFFLIDLDKETKIVIFGSTDDSVAGWLENIELLKTSEPKCAIEALKYVEKHFDKKYKYFFVGHSKGGLECAYTYLNVPKVIKNNILKAYDFDGPGFSLETIKNFRNKPDNFELICPQSSCVGRFFHQPCEYKIVKAKKFGVLQHNPNTWQIENDHFVTTNKFTRLSTKEMTAVNCSFQNLSKEQKEQLINSTINVISSKDENTLTQLAKHPFKILCKFINLSKQEKKNFRRVAISIIQNRYFKKDLNNKNS